MENTLSTSNRVFPYYQGESTIFDKGNFLLIQIIYPPASEASREVANLFVAVFSLFSLHLVPCTNYKLSGVQTCIYTVEVKKEKKLHQIIERGALKGKEG